VTRSQAFRRVLPKWIPPYASTPVPVQHPDDAPTLAYVIVGPRVRGKFDVAKANALGVPKGPMWAQLTRGQSVTVTVDDGQGKKVERVVRPEECVSKSEGAGVSLLFPSSTILTFFFTHGCL
jgi:ribonuclease Z